MTITEVCTTKRGRISVYVDGEYLFAVEQESWQMASLRVGDEVDEQQLNALLADSNLIKAKRRALNMLSARDYTTGVLKERLAAKTDSRSAAEAVERMQELGLVDDARYAENYARELCDTKLFGRRRIRLEMQKRRIPSDIIQEVMQQLDGDEAERAAELLRRKFGRIEDEADCRKAFSLLERSGYGYQDIRAALRDMGGETDDDLF